MAGIMTGTQRKIVKVSGTVSVTGTSNVDNKAGTGKVILTDFNDLSKRTVRNLGIYNQLKQFSVSACSIGAKQGVIVLPDEIKKELLEREHLKDVYTYTNAKNYYSTYYKIEGVNALLVEFKFKIQGMFEEEKILYRIIPEVVVSRSGREHKVLDYLKDTAIRYGEKATEYSINGEKHSVERLILGLRDFDNANYYNSDTGKKYVAHHDIQKAILSVDTLAIGYPSEHIKYHHKNRCYSRSGCLLIRNLDDYNRLYNILRIIYN